MKPPYLVRKDAKIDDLLTDMRQHKLQIAMVLDDKKKVIRCDKLFEGTVNSTPITVKKVVAAAVNSNATGIVLAHNHPGGVALPSARDLRATEKIFKALKLINVELCDHIIVADDDFAVLHTDCFT